MEDSMLMRALTGVFAAIFSGAKEQRSDDKRLADGRLRSLVERYRESCACRGDQYGSWGPCELCKEPLAGARPPGDPRVPRPSRNYLVTQTATEKFRCEVMIQDGWERWDESSLTEAQESVIRAAKVLNGTVLDEGNISVRLLRCPRQGR